MVCNRIVVLIFFFLCFSQSFAAEPKWQAQLPSIAKEPAIWTDLLKSLNENKMNFGSLTASLRILGFFNDVESKEFAYKTIIRLSDEGYPFSIQNFFQTGDLTPAKDDYDFLNSYNLYKFILNHERKLDKWAKIYLEGIDKANYQKYIFFEAIDAYTKKDYKSAEEKLRSILSKDLGPERAIFVKKVARTLARVYFDKQEYEKSFDIYSNFLLKSEPIIPSDWLEAAWDLFYLKRYQESLGMLYNMESKTQDRYLNLEKYTIRALSYRNLCAIQNTEALIQTFQRDYSETLKGIKHGEMLSKYPSLDQIQTPDAQNALQIQYLINQLAKEGSFIGALPDKLKPLAKHLYETEIAMLNRKKISYLNRARESAANKLIMTDENLRFFLFDVQREKYNPDLVFKPSIDEDSPSVEEMNDNTFRIHWNQYGDFWKDERNKYWGMLPNRCSE